MGGASGDSLKGRVQARLGVGKPACGQGSPAPFPGALGLLEDIPPPLREVKLMDTPTLLLSSLA